MKKMRVEIETGYLNVSLGFDFEVEDDDTPDEIYNTAREVIANKLCWNVLDEDGNEVEL